MNTRLDRFHLKPNVLVEVYPDEQYDWSWADKRLMNKVEKGQVEQVVVIVKVFDKTGYVEGIDCLGGIVVGLAKHREEVKDAIANNKMVAEARLDLKTKLKAIRGEKQ